MPKSLQISIPSTSLSSDSKPHTVYHITLDLPLRKHTIQKRYTEFADLHTQLTSSTGAAPPASLPGKSWFRSTVSNTALTEQRRRDLELYLRAILDSTDARWRSSPAWRAFLALPANLLSPNAGTSTGSDWDASARSSSRNHYDATTTLDAAAWLHVHRDARTQLQSARLALRRRDDARVPQDQHAAAADAKAALVRAATGIARCEGALSALDDDSSNPAGKLGAGELRRRKDLLAGTRKEVEALEAQLRAGAIKSAGGGEQAAQQASAADRGALLAKPAGKPGRVLGGGPQAKETERTRELDNSGVLQLQKRVMREQDEDVLELGKAVGRMKEMGILINEELEVQSAMLGLVEGDVDRLQGKLDVGKKRIEKIR